jgi:hypothetical protein
MVAGSKSSNYIARTMELTGIFAHPLLSPGLLVFLL